MTDVYLPSDSVVQAEAALAPADLPDHPPPPRAPVTHASGLSQDLPLDNAYMQLSGMPVSEPWADNGAPLGDASHVSANYSAVHASTVAMVATSAIQDHADDDDSRLSQYAFNHASQRELRFPHYTRRLPGAMEHVGSGLCVIEARVLEHQRLVDGTYSLFNVREMA